MRNKFAIKLIKMYQDGLPGRPARCRFYPSCSHYAMECYEKFNFVKASFLTTKRILKCNPFHKCGYDPVPLTKAEKKALLEIEEPNTIEEAE